MDLAIAIPARNEEFLKLTVEDILKNKRGKTEIIVGLDGKWADPPLTQHPDVKIVYHHSSIGQRAITNQCLKVTDAKYVMKVDAHCSFDEGFDVKMLEAFKETGDNVVMAPVMRNLHVFDWVCPLDKTVKYQDKGDDCPKCQGKMEKKIIWQPRVGSRNWAYYFSSEPKFGYHTEWKTNHKEDLVETMSLQGSCFMATKENYFNLNLCDESLGSWGSQGIEVACKMWLSGGRVLSNRKTWYAHCFRTKSVFGFPYKLSGQQVEGAKHKVKDMFFNQKWDKQVRPLSWLIEKFSPPEWSEEDIKNLKESEARALTH